MPGDASVPQSAPAPQFISQREEVGSNYTARSRAVSEQEYHRHELALFEFTSELVDEIFTDWDL